MKATDYRDIASEIIERYITTKEANKKLFKDNNYDRGYKEAVQMVLSVLNDKEATEAKKLLSIFKYSLKKTVDTYFKPCYKITTVKK